MTAAELIKCCPLIDPDVALLIADIHALDVQRARLQGERDGFAKGVCGSLEKWDELLHHTGGYHSPLQPAESAEKAALVASLLTPATTTKGDL